MENCLFCKIIDGEVPSWKVYEDENVYAFLDIFPVNYGHTQVIPKKHYKDIHSIPETDLTNVAIASKKIAAAIKEGLDADGVNIIQNNGQAAGQVVLHSHTHIIPRFRDDGLKMWGSKQFDEIDRDKVLEKIKKAL